MNKLFGLVVLLSIFTFGMVAQAETAAIPTNTAVTSERTDSFVPMMGFNKNLDEQGNFSWKDVRGGMRIHGHGYNTNGGSLSTLWMIGWLFTIGYLRLKFWKGVLALIVWPYYVGKKFHKGE